MPDGSPGRSLPSTRRVLATVVVVVALALAGCSVISGGDSQLPNSTVAAESYRTLDGYSATVTIERSDKPTTTLRIWVDPDDERSRSEVLAPSSRAGNVALSNGSTIIQYNATDNEYVRISTSGSNLFERGAQRIADAVAAAHSDSETTSGAPPVGGPPLPVVPDGQETPPEGTQFVAEYGGTDSVAGRTAHVITYSAEGNRSEGILEQTVWLDTETFVTLKSRQVSRFNGNRSTYTLTLSNVTFDPDFASGRFVFDPPAGATLNESESFDVTRYDSRDALIEATPFSVPDPSVPARYHLVTADHIDGTEFEAAQLRYRAGTSSLAVTKTTEQSYIDTDTGETVTIGDQTGRYRTSGVRSLVTWECGDDIYVVVGDARQETLVGIARSVACS